MTTKKMLQELAGRADKSVPEGHPDWMTRAGDPAMQEISGRKAALLLMISQDVARLKADRGGILIRAFDFIDASCHIAAATMKKVLLGQCAVTREFLYKYTVGLGLTLERAQEYFELQGGRLRDDAEEAELIAFNALKDRDDIDSLIDQFQRLLGRKL